MKPTSEIEELIANETKRRLEEMESPNYVFAQPFLKSDFTIVIGLVLIKPYSDYPSHDRRYSIKCLR